MKRWYIANDGNEYRCSLLSLSSKSKIGSFRSDCGFNIVFQFMKFFDFSKAKAGKQQTGWVKLPHTESKVRSQIIFR